ncbi:MAG: hypothetical protein CTY19_02565 [Methylomonas sp.]|jgi:hypothetical protein|nr:MAG: hypothetical protein CTY19_02565 [Methylomonas sp.]
MIKIQRYARLCIIAALLATQTGCLEWMHAYQTYLQMQEFDRYFTVTAQDDFTVHFKQPRLLTDDFIALAKLHASTEKQTAEGKHWRYWFRKTDKNNQIISPEVSFYCDLTFDKYDKVRQWSFSKLFLQIAPPEFLEASFRSLGGAEINEGKKQLRAKAEFIDKVSADLPKKAVVVQQLGEPLDIENEDKQEIYKYQFHLDAREVEEGYEDRTLSEVKLTFDKETTELVKMSGRFAGLKISINYRNFQEEDDNKVASASN